MKKIIVVFLLLTGSLYVKAQYPAVNFTLAGQINPETGANFYGDKYSGCWGWYQQTKNKEYAIACSQSGTYWVDASNPATPTVSAYRAGAVTGAVWREVKTYQNYCYVISDDGGNGTNSFQIFDMQYLPDSVSKVYDSQSLIRRAHALWIDGNKLYVSAVRQSGNTFSTLNVYSLANPVNPVLLRKLDQDYPFINYVHDAFVRNDTVYASCANQGLYVFKLTSTNTFLMLGSLTTYPSSGYNHSSSLTPDGQTLVFMDEVPSALPIKVANVSNLQNIQVLATTNQYTATTPHNPFVVNNQYCFASSYQEGLQLYDISNPSVPVLAGYFDTYYQGGGNTGNWGSDPYAGQWGCYPYFPSKTIFALDMTNGLIFIKTALYANPPVVAAFTLQPRTCPGKTVTLTNTSSGATTYSWSFSNGVPANPGSINSSATFAGPGIYSVTLNASNPSYTSSVTHTLEVTTMSASVTGSDALCATCGGTATATPIKGTAPYTYSWMPSGGTASVATNLAPGCYTVFIKDGNGCTSLASKCISYNVGIASNPAEGSMFNVYPNPANAQIFIEWKELNFSYTLTDELGQKVRSNKNNSGAANIDTENLAPGIYILEVVALKTHQRKKINVAH